MSRTFRIIIVVSMLTQPIAALAQIGPLASLIPDLFDQTIILPNPTHEAHFLDETSSGRDAGLQINSSIVGQLIQPLSSSAGGFIYEFDEELGILTRATDSFGPLFAERPDTIGKGKWNFGISVFSTSYDTIDGLGLGTGDLFFSLTHKDVNEDGTTIERFFEGDLITAEMRLKLDTQTSLFFANYGITDRFDLSIAVPYVSVSLDAELSTEIFRNSTAGFDPPVHFFEGGTLTQVTRAGGDESGIGDILVRGKFNLARQEGRGAALAMDIRLPTGDEDNLLGTGGTLAKFFFVGAVTFGKWSPHLNVGYTFADGGSDFVGDLNDEFNFTTGFDTALSPKVTFATDFIWRTIRDASRVETLEETFFFRECDGCPVSSLQRPVLNTRIQDVNVLYGAVGMKFNPTGTMLISANLLWTLSDDGLVDDDVSPLLAFEYTF